MKIETIVLNEERHVTLTCYLHDPSNDGMLGGKRPAMLVVPGGGYAMISETEGEPVALEYLRAGYQAFVLRYTVGANAKWPEPLDDFDQAMECILSNAEAWNIYPEKIAACGFSAGGHLVACAASIAKHRPAAVVAGYPAIVEEMLQYCLKDAPDAAKLVNRKTSPVFITVSRMDTIVPVHNSVAMIDALERSGIAFEAHIYAFGQHGYSTAESWIYPGAVMADRIHRWVQDSIGWLQDMLGKFQPSGMSEPACPRRLMKNDDPYLSIDYTVGFLKALECAKEIMQPIVESVRNSNPKMSLFGTEREEEQFDNRLANSMTLSSFLRIAGVPDERRQAIHEQLQMIKNPYFVE